MHPAQTKIIADSINEQGNRLTTFQLRYWRPIHSELMTHRVFSRNAGSSRARPSAKIIEQVRDDPWGPIHWGLNQPGMQAGAELEGEKLTYAKHAWFTAASGAANMAAAMLREGAHKQIVNRLLEPFTYIDVLVTATEYNNWFVLRNHPDAQPEIQDLARRMKQDMESHEPTLLKPGEWHLPYILPEDHEAVYQYCKKNRVARNEPWKEETLSVLIKISVARCARVSYKAFDGKVAPIEKDIELYDRLLSSQPLHASPAEHQATPDTMISAPPGSHWSQEWNSPELHGNFRGWCQYRKMLPNEFVSG